MSYVRMMNPMLRFLMLFATLGFWSGSSLAMDGNGLFEACGGNNKHRAELIAYVSGVWDKAASDSVTATVYLTMRKKPG